MSARRWLVRNGNGVTLVCRAGLPERWDVAVERSVAPLTTPGQRRRFAQQVRQDIWRAVGRTRGFVPLVQVSTDGTETVIRAGGALLTRAGRPDALSARIARVLDSAQNRARWLSFARRAGDRSRHRARHRARHREGDGKGHVQQDPDRKPG